MAKYKAKFIDTSLAKAGEVFSVTPDNKIVFIDMNSTGQKETFILTPADISNKYVDLKLEVSSSLVDKTILTIKAGVQRYNIEYKIINDNGGILRRISWDGMGLESLLTTGEILVVSYYNTTNFKIVDNTESITLTATDITNKYIDLSREIDSSKKDQTFLKIVGGPSQYYPTDFDIINDDHDNLKRISWNGKSMDGVITAGETFIVTYKIGF